MNDPQWSPQWEIEKRDQRIRELEAQARLVRCFVCGWQGLPEDVEGDHSKKCRADRSELEAQCAAMREALEWVKRAMIDTGQEGDGDNDPRYPTWNKIVAALATDAGKAMLEQKHRVGVAAIELAKRLAESEARAEKAEGERDEEKHRRISAESRCHELTVRTEVYLKGEEATYAHAFEEAAKVAETAVGSRLLIVPTIPEAVQTIAAAIRARAKGGGET